MRNIQKDTSNLYRNLYVINDTDNAPYCMPDMYGEVETLVRYTEIIPICLYELEL